MGFIKRHFQESKKTIHRRVENIFKLFTFIIYFKYCKSDKKLVPRIYLKT